jgi:hypothetical protein
MNPTIFRLLEEVLPRFGIDRLRCSREAFRSSVFRSDCLGIVRRNNLAKWALLRWRAHRLRPILASTDDFFGVLYSGAVSRNAMSALLRASSSSRSLEICIHPGFPAPQNISDYPRPGYNAFISAPARQIEHDVISDPILAGLVGELGLVLRSFDGARKA